MIYPVCVKCEREVIPDDGELCGACAKSVIAAAEERGRPRGVEERDELRAALFDLFGAVQNPDLYIEGVSTVTRPLRIAIAKARAALAPRDSGKET